MKDAFYNVRDFGIYGRLCVQTKLFQLPIRRNAHPNASRTLELVKREIESLALVSHKVSFSVEDNAKALLEGPGKGRILTIPKVNPFSIYLIKFLSNSSRPNPYYRRSDIYMDAL